MNEKIYQIGITLLNKVSCAHAKKLIEWAGSVPAVFELTEKDLLQISGVDAPTAQAIVCQFPVVLEKAKQEWEFTQKYHIETLFYQDKAFPQRLLECEDGPILLYYKGNIDLNKAHFLAIVGTRKATEYGKALCRKLVADLAHQNIVIISGLAYGIDGCAHKAALEHQLHTLGVMASGMNQIYPAAHKQMAASMVHNGGLITEFIAGTFPEPYQFIRRNRIIAGMADAVVVVESAAKGGSLVTADLANSYYRDVFTFPGKITDPYSIGCNQLIKYHKASLIENAQDLIKAMNWDLPSYNDNKQEISLFESLDDQEQLIVNLLIKYSKLPIDTICNALNKSMEETRSILLGLEFKDQIRCLPGDVFELG